MPTIVSTPSTISNLPLHTHSLAILKLIPSVGTSILGVNLGNTAPLATTALRIPKIFQTSLEAKAHPNNSDKSLLATALGFVAIGFKVSNPIGWVVGGVALLLGLRVYLSRQNHADTEPMPTAETEITRYRNQCTQKHLGSLNNSTIISLETLFDYMLAHFNGHRTFCDAPPSQPLNILDCFVLSTYKPDDILSENQLQKIKKIICEKSKIKAPW